MSAVQPMANLAHSENPQHETERWLALWRNATPEAQREALRILRAATEPQQEKGGEAMSIFIPHTDMTAREIVNTCIQARAIVCLCERAAWSDLQNGSEAKIPVVAEDIQFALQLVADLLVPVQEALESHEGVETEEPIRMTGGGRNG